MDPDTNWEEQQRIKARIRAKSTHSGDYGRLRELQQALNQWIRGGGYKPRGMTAQKPRHASKRKFSGESADEHAARIRTQYCPVCKGPHVYKHGRS